MPFPPATSLRPLLLAPALALILAEAGSTGSVVCTTSLEAPPSFAAPSPALRQLPAAPVEVSRCVSVQSIPDLVERRFYSYTAPFARGVDLTHQVTDILGIAMGGGDGSKLMGFGFPDQTIVWDGSALQNTAQVLLEEQGTPLPWRTADVGSGFSSSLGSGGASTMASPWQDHSSNRDTPVRGLW
jgi:hypothetical protein